MNFFKKINNKLKRDFKLSFTNPDTFDEVWSITTSGLRILSLSIIFILLLGTAFFFLFNSSFFKSKFLNGDESVARIEIEKQNEKVIELSNQLVAQEEYIQNIKYILSGQVPVDFPIDSIKHIKDSLSTFMYDTEITEVEKINAEKVKEDLISQHVESSSNNILYFSKPVSGIISQQFNQKNHHGIDIVTKKDAVIKSCLAGVILYSAYTVKDGFVIVIEHRDNMISIYKHAQRVLKETGDYVKTGDPIGIVGNTGENSDGPHLHFEIWQNLRPVNPEDYLHFTQ